MPHPRILISGGSILWMEEDTLFYAPILLNDTIEWQNYGEVTNIDDDQKELDRINAAFGTEMVLTDFPGR